MFLLVLTPRVLLADEIRIESTKSDVNQGDQFLVNVQLESGEELNALDGKIGFQENALRLISVEEGNSAVNFWLEQPHVSSPGIITFAGMSPGGFVGANKKVFSLLFEAREAGDIPLHLLTANVYKNDGSGTKISLKPGEFSLHVRPSDGFADTLVQQDDEPPEDFTPIVSSDPSVYGGKNFLSFATQDKGLGIAYFEVREGVLGRYKRASSPYLLTRQLLDRPIYIRAVDRKGNIREEVVLPQVVVPLWRQGEWISVFVVLFLLYELAKLIAHRKMHHHIKRIVHIPVRGDKTE